MAGWTGLEPAINVVFLRRSLLRHLFSGSSVALFWPKTINSTKTLSGGSPGEYGRVVMPPVGQANSKAVGRLRPILPFRSIQQLLL